jgi:Adenylate and Guanylate cyclase catalytic domain
LSDYPLKVYVEIRNYTGSAVVLFADYYVYKGALRPDPNARGDKPSGKYEFKFPDPNGMLQEVEYLLRHRDSVSSWVPIDPTHTDAEVDAALKQKKSQSCTSSVPGSATSPQSIGCACRFKHAWGRWASPGRGPEDVMALLRDYHAAIGEIIIKYNGTLERYAGDGVMVVFNDPVPVENPAFQAVLMALELREAIGALTATWSRLGHEIGFGIGIAHGFAALGTIGFVGRFDYAAIGTYPTSPLVFAMRPSQDKSSSVLGC